jgi:sugar phosphate isomerase/epimerase
MKIGAAQWPFKWDPPYDDAMRRIAALGLRAVELVVWNPRDLREYYTGQTVADLRSLADGLSLEIAEFVGTAGDLAHPDAARRADAVAYFGEIVKVARDLGTTTVNSIAPYPFAFAVPWLPDRAAIQEWRVAYPSGLDWDQNWRDYVEATKRCVGLCENANLRWAIEPHPYRYVANTASMLRLIDHVDSETLGCNVDPSHLLPVAETPHAAVYQLGRRVFNCHISDNWGDANAHFRPGKGKVDWRAFLRSLRDVGFDGSLCLELEDTTGVSRGAAGRPVVAALGAKPAATEDFLDENLIAIDYLRDAARREGITLDVGTPSSARAAVG